MENVSFTLGWELESARYVLNVPEEVHSGSDGSVNGDGVEYRLKPAYVQDRVGAMFALMKLTLPQNNIRVDSSCGYHVHMGILNNGKATPEQLKLWASWCVTLGIAIEDSIFEAVPESRKNNRYCIKWNIQNDIPNGIIKSHFNSEKSSNELRYRWINIVEMFRSGGIRTVEVRLMGHTSDYDYLFCWTALCLMIGESASILMDDPSLFQREAIKLRAYAKRVEECFIHNLSPLSKCGLIIDMGLKAKLLPSFINTIERHDLYIDTLMGNRNLAYMSNHEYNRAQYHTTFPNADGVTVRRRRAPIADCFCQNCVRIRARRELGESVPIRTYPTQATVQSQTIQRLTEFTNTYQNVSNIGSGLSQDWIRTANVPIGAGAGPIQHDDIDDSPEPAGRDATVEEETNNIEQVEERPF